MPEIAGGERPLRPSQLGSPILRRHGRDAAAHCFRRCYEAWPDLDRRFGERGRQFVAEDAFGHLEHLDAAVGAGEPAAFADYADWLTGLLAARGVGPEQVAGAFGFLAEALERVACPAAQRAHRDALVAVLRDNQARILARPGALAPAEDRPGAPPYLDYYRHLVALDRRAALEVVERYLAGRGDPLDLYAEVLEPALRLTGCEWQAGRISVAHEHYISEVTRDVVRRCGESLAAGPIEPAVVAVACCVPRERHTLGLLMVADGLRAGGVAVHVLGEGLPGEAVLGLLDQVGAGWLCLSCAMDVHLRDAARLIRQVRQARPGLHVAVGGAALRSRGEALSRRLGADFTAPDLAGVRRLLPGWLREIQASR